MTSGDFEKPSSTFPVQGYALKLNMRAWKSNHKVAEKAGGSAKQRLERQRCRKRKPASEFSFKKDGSSTPAAGDVGSDGRTDGIHTFCQQCGKYLRKPTDEMNAMKPVKTCTLQSREAVTPSAGCNAEGFRDV